MFDSSRAYHFNSRAVKPPRGKTTGTGAALLAQNALTQTSNEKTDETFN